MLAGFRAVPVLAETSLLAAGMVRMPMGRFLPAMMLSNAGVALVYAWIGAQSAEWDSFLLAVAGSIAVPALGWGVGALAWKGLGLGAQAPAAVPVADPIDDAITPRFAVDFEFPVVFTENALAPENPRLADVISRLEPGRRHKLMVFVDAGVAAAGPRLAGDFADYAAAYGDRLELAAPPETVPGGEAAKADSNLVPHLHKRLLDLGIDRQSVVVAIGGGAVLDTVGFAAATFHRGMRLVRMPSTVLAQNDAGIGVKNGVNGFGVKNLIGSFAPPFAVVNDAAFLTTLPERDRRAGLAEAVKVACIRDAKFFQWMEARVSDLRAFEPTATAAMIRRCAELHLEQITRAGDPFESGSARPLDYGHWSAHRLESLTGHTLRHGEAVAIGMALDARYAVNAGLLAERDANRLIRLLEGLGFDLFHPALLALEADGSAALLRGLDEFREHLGGALCITMLTGIGHAVEIGSIDRDAMLAAARRLSGEPACA